jgi:hypothetical protein
MRYQPSSLSLDSRSNRGFFVSAESAVPSFVPLQDPRADGPSGARLPPASSELIQSDRGRGVAATVGQSAGLVSASKVHYKCRMKSTKAIRGSSIVVVVMAILLVGCTPGHTPSAESQQATATPTLVPLVSAAPSASPSPSAAPLAEPVVLSGDGTMKTAKFHLSAGDYLATWTSVDPKGVFGSYLQSTEVTVFEPIGVFQASGSTYLYGIADADYYLDVNSTSAWTVTIAPAS